MRYLSCPVFRKPELPFFKVGEQISTCQKLHHNEVVVLVFKDILQLNDIRVLTNS